MSSERQADLVVLQLDKSYRKQNPMCCSDFEQITKNKLLIDMKLVLTAVVFFVCFFL